MIQGLANYRPQAKSDHTYSFMDYLWQLWASQVVLLVKNLPANAGDPRDSGSIPELGRSPGERNVNPFQCSCLENPKDREAWQVTVHRVAKTRTRLKRLSGHTATFASQWRWQTPYDWLCQSYLLPGIISLICGILKTKQTHTRKQKQTHRERRCGCQRGGIKRDEWNRGGRWRGTDFHLKNK